ncbi:hypothetical protein KR009_001822 [Drosophila setifemur]|nr:hypothetical protein KR009_001822 [Drosophila setifemur]
MEQHQKVERLVVRLVPASTAEERSRNIIANVVLEDGLVPFIDDQVVEKVTLIPQESVAPAEQKPRLRYYSVGPSTYKLLCPLCRERSDAAVMRVASWKDISCCLSLLSCVFPLFWICCVCTCCGCNRDWTTKGVYCSSCGGKVGIQRKAK